MNFPIDIAISDFAEEYQEDHQAAFAKLGQLLSDKRACLTRIAFLRAVKGITPTSSVLLPGTLPYRSLLALLFGEDSPLKTGKAYLTQDQLVQLCEVLQDPGAIWSFHLEYVRILGTRLPCNDVFEYYANALRRWGVWEGDGPRLTEAQVAHRQATLRFTLRSGRVHRVEVIRGTGELTDRYDMEIDTYYSWRKKDDPYTGTARACRWEFFYQDDKLVEEVAFDLQHNKVYHLAYSTDNPLEVEIDVLFPVTERPPIRPVKEREPVHEMTGGHRSSTPKHFGGFPSYLLPDSSWRITTLTDPRDPSRANRTHTLQANIDAQSAMFSERLRTSTAARYKSGSSGAVADTTSEEGL